MSDAERKLVDDRASRSAARGLFDTRLAQVKADLAARGISGRVKDKAIRQGEEALAQGLDIARENRGIVAATGAALALWFFRKPLIAMAGRLNHRLKDDVQEAGTNTTEDQAE